jgi:hypothetical protein
VPILKATIEEFEKARNAYENREPLLWVDWPVPSSIIRAFDAPHVYPEFFLNFCQYEGGAVSDHYYSTVKTEGYPDDLCGMSKISPWAHYSGHIYEPRAIISSTQACDSNMSVNKIFHHIKKTFRITALRFHITKTDSMWSILQKILRD